MKQNRIHATAVGAVCAMVLGLAGLLTTTSSAQALPTPQAMQSPMPINVMTNNPNGPNWLRAFDRHPAPATSRSMPMDTTRCRTINHKMLMNHRMMMKRRWMMKHRMMTKHRMMRHSMPMPTPTAMP